MMKVTDLKENDGILCTTQEEENQISELMHEAGLKWINGKSYLKKTARNFFNEECVHYPAGGYCLSKKRAEEEGHRIYSASYFLEEFTEGELVEVSEDEDFSSYFYGVHLATIKGALEPYIISWEEEIDKRDRGEEFNCFIYKYVRKLSPPKEMTVKQIEDKLGYKVTII